MKRNYIEKNKKFHRKGAEEVRSNRTRGRQCQSGSPAKKTLQKRVSGGLLLNVFSKTSTNVKLQIKQTFGI